MVPSNTPMVAFEARPVLASPSGWWPGGVGAGARRGADEQIVVVHVGDSDGPVEVARHAAGHPGSAAGSIDEHFSDPAGRGAGPGAEAEERRARPSSSPSARAPGCG